MNIAIIGTGYVGLVSGACFAELGVNVICIDTDTDKISKLKQGIIPIYEPSLEDMVKRNYNDGRLNFSCDLREYIDNVDVIFIAVGTPPQEDGSADLSHVLKVAETIGSYLNKYTLVVVKSTVPVGTCNKVKSIIKESIRKRGFDFEFDIASNPEFLKEGCAIKDFMAPDRVIVGVDSDKARDIMTTLYRPILLNNFRVRFTDILSSEMIKYASNCMLATRISFMNEIAQLCERVGADVNMVRLGMGDDKRIGRDFLYPGCGYGGSCFPKDVNALVKKAEQYGLKMRVLSAVEDVNKEQKLVLFNKLQDYYGESLKYKTICIWGLAFKPQTDDIREAPSLVIIDRLLSLGCKVKVYDPIAMDVTYERYGDKLVYCDNMYDAVNEADALLLVTEWKVFRLPNWSKISQSMRGRLILDGRNIYNSQELISLGFDYKCIGM